MNCARFEEQIVLYAGGDLEERKAHRLEAHLRECATCRDLAASLAEDQAALHDLRAEPADLAMLEQIRSRVLAQVAGRPPAPRPLFGWAWRLALAGSLAAAVLAVFLWRSRRAEPPQPVAVAQAPQPVMELPAPAPRRVPPAPRAPRRRPAPQRHVETASAKPLMVKLATDDPNVVIIWLIGQNGG